MCNPQALALLEEKIANNAHLLHEALRVAAIDDQTNDAMSVVKQGVYYLQDISIAAGEADLQGLQTICILSNQHLLQVVQQPDVSRKQAACEALEYFPKLATSYLQQPHNQLNQQALIEHVQRAEWASPLPPESATLLADLLANDISNILENPEQMPKETTIMTHEDFKSEPSERDLALAAELDAAFNPQPMDNFEDFLTEEPLLELDEQQTDEFGFSDDTLEDFLSEERIEELSLDSPVEIFEHNDLTNIENIDESLIAEEESLQTQSIDNIDDILDDLSWDDLAEEISAQPEVSEISNNFEEETENFLELEDATFESLAEEIIAETIAEQSFDQLTSEFDFNSEEQPVEESSHLNEDFFQLENTEELAADFQEQPIIQEDALFQDNVFDEQSYAFLDTQESEEPPAAFLENNSDFNDELLTLSLEESEPEDISFDSLLEEHQQLETNQEQTFENELAELVEIEETPWVEESFSENNIVSPQLIENTENSLVALEKTLSTAAPHLQTNLEVICSTSDESALINAISQYNQQLNVIEKSIQATQLVGLEEFISFIKENLHELAMSSLEERQQAHTVFAAWSDLMIDYLIADYINDSENHAINLITFLQNPDWFSPLSEQDANFFLESLSSNSHSKIEETPQISDIKLDTNLSNINELPVDIMPNTLKLSDQEFEELTSLDNISNQEQHSEESEHFKPFVDIDDFEDETLEQSSNEIPFDELSDLDSPESFEEETEQLAELDDLEINELDQEIALQNNEFDALNDLEEIEQLEETNNLQENQGIELLSELEEIEHNEEISQLADPFDDFENNKLQELNELEEDPFAISNSELESLEETEQLAALDNLKKNELKILSDLEENQKESPPEMIEDAFAISEMDNLSENELNALEETAELTEEFSPEELAELEAFEAEQLTQETSKLNELEELEENQLVADSEIDPFAISEEIENTQTNQEVAFDDPFGDFETPQAEIDPFAISEETGNTQTNQEVVFDDLFGDFETPQTEIDPFAISEETENNVFNQETVEHDPFDDFEETKINEPLVEAIDPAVLLEPVNNALMTAFDDLSAATQRLVSADDDSEELLEAVGHYAETLQPVLDAAESNNLTGILEVGNFLNENVLALGMLPKAERQNLQENLDVFPALLLDYLLAPQESADGLIEHLKNPNWSSPLSEERAEEIKTILLQIGQTPVEENSFNPLFGFDEEPVELETCSGEIYLGKPEQIERVNAAIIESAEALSTSLENFVSMQNDNELFLEAVDTYTTHVQNIWDAAEQAGLNGLQDVCNFVNENIMALSAEETEKRQLVHEQLDAWPMLILNYITSPAENIAPLVEHLQNPNWMMPLDESQADLLIKALQQGSTKTDAPIEDPFADSFGTTETTSVEETVEEDVSNDGDSEISLGNSEMLEMLSGEIESAQAELDEFLEKFVNTPNNKPEFAEIASNYNELVGRLALASEMVGLTGLQDVCNFVMSNVEILTEKSQSDRQKSKNALQKWPSLVLAYLKAPTNNIVALLNHFRENDWPSPLPDEKAHALLNNLRSSSSVPEDDGSEPSRATQAKPEDVALQIPEDVNQDLLAAYLQEAPQNAADFTACLQRIVKNPAPDDVKLGQRIAHTLKGSSNIIGIKGVATLAHNLEDILEYLFENAVPPPPALTKTMIEAADTLEIMIDSLQGKEEPPANALAILQEVLDWANRIDRNQLNVTDDEIAKRKAEIAAQAANAPKPAAPTGGGAVAQAAAAGAPAEAGETEQFLRVPTRTVDNLLRLIGEMSISVGQIQERLKHVIHSTKSLNSQGMTVQHKGYELETLVVVRDVTNRRKHRLDDGKNIIAEDQQQAFDSLEFEQYNELHSLTHSFIESIADSRELGGSILEDLTALDGMFIHQERLNKEFQQIVMTTRMVPIKSIIARLERIVRQTCRSTEKLADLVMVGGDILIDGDVLTKLLDPLMHILRNSIDHGMELPADRVASGKPETGTVTIRCYRQGNNIVVKCEDDGRGLNFERIRQIAVDRGLITENQELSPRDLSRLILIPGFSTKGAVTQVSGRGVGMDVVHTSILELKGSLEIESETGRGSAIILILPMTLVTEHVLLVGVTTQKFALPTHHLAQALTPDSGEFRRIGDSLNFHMDKNAYPVMTLGDLLGLSGSPPATENDTRPLVLVKGESSITAVVVDYLYDSRNLVSKTMGRYVKKVRGVGGASILGDGSVVAMIDLPELLRSPAQSLMPLSSGNSEGETNAVVSAPHIMIVDDSLSVRKVLSQLIEDQGFKTMLAKDGLEAVEQVSQRKPDVMLVDMEMPRMNGIELTAHIRANEATKHIPIFMITSRTTEKHRQLAKEAGVSAYLTKPYQDTELLGLINDALRNKR